ncbi:odorant receptor 46a-like [Tenebrio molitor]|uniref:odorant receptor 46a-like n=1 Tax=Tenebrio molitor TaxID=7067 RepID=UPI0036249755
MMRKFDRKLTTPSNLKLEDETIYRYDWALTIKQNLSILRISGLWPRDNYKIDPYTILTAIFLLTIFLPNLLSQIIKVFFILDDLTTLSATIYLLLTEILFVVKIFSLMTNMTTLKQAMKLLDTDMFQPKNTEQVALVQPNLDSWSTIYNSFTTMCVGAIVLLSIFPLLDKSGTGKNLPSISWFPYNTQTSPAYELTYIYQVIGYAYTGMNHVNLDSFIAALNVFIGCQFDILCDNLRHLQPGDDAQESLVKCIKHHKLILKFATICNESFNLAFFVQLLVSATITGLTLFQLSTMVPFTAGFFYFTSYYLASVTQMFQYCWFSNEVHLKSANVPCAAFESDWTDLSLEVKKNLLFFIMRTQKALHISALDVFHLSVESFVAILKTAWSYYALLRSAEEK